MKQTWAVLAALIAAVSSAQTNSDQHTGSLFQQSSNCDLLSTRHAMHKGDILTVIISENSQSSFNASTSATKKDSTQAGPLGIPGLSYIDSGLLNSLLQGGSSAANSSVSGTGATSNTQQFTAQISVIVTEVLPNGNLKVQGSRWLKVNKNEQQVTLTGVVRPDDVSATNTVLSENVADARIVSSGTGLIADRQRRGILTRLLDWLF